MAKNRDILRLRRPRTSALRGVPGESDGVQAGRVGALAGDLGPPVVINTPRARRRSRSVLRRRPPAGATVPPRDAACAAFMRVCDRSNLVNVKGHPTAQPSTSRADAGGVRHDP